MAWRCTKVSCNPQDNLAHWLICTQVEAPAPSKKTVKEIARAAKAAVKLRKNQQRRKARRSWDLEQEEKSRMQARADADAELSRGRAAAARDGGGAFRSSASETREAARGHPIESRGESP